MSERAASLVQRDRAIVVAAAACLTVVSWLLLTLGHHDAAGEAAWLRPWRPGAGPWPLAAAWSMWLIMMIAMMLPPIMPWILLFASIERRSTGERPYGRTTVFVGGYFVVWAVFCVVATGGQAVLLQLAPEQFDGWRLGAGLGGIVLIAAGLFQLSGLKAACLSHCRSPLGFFLSRWKDGPVGALRMGATHGLYCLGCCWALMALSFALGVMNLLWMAVLTFILCVEKIAPGGVRVGRAFGVGLLIWGGWILPLTP